ncbi:MAG: M23 family metallopeptidase [Spirochaetales bacterium]|nr:M23 family metallopeptidase [Spirochaetales bacterium]
MNQLIAHQRVVKRKRRKERRLAEKAAKFAAAPRPGQLPADVAFTREFRRILKEPRFLAGPKALYIIGAIVAAFCLLLLLSNGFDRSVAGIGGGLGTFPRDAGIDTLLDLYLSPGKSPDDGAGDIMPGGKMLMSYDPVTYVVERGDTVSGIAEKFDLDMSTIISFNGIDNVRRLLAGVEIKVPPVDGVMHLVKRNESLSSIARSYGVDLEPILDINNIDSEIIHEGDKLFVPNAQMSSVAYHKAMGDLFVYPLRGVLSSGFGMRKDPFTGLMAMHRGYDIVARVGTPVEASNEGRVIYTGENSLYGKYVLLSHQGGFQTLYAHLDKWLVSEGQRVAQKQKIGLVGNTGRSTGPHLHFSIYYNGDALDPGKYLYY